MDQAERSALIRKYLAINTINHGQVYLCQTHLPNQEEVQQSLSSERRQKLEASLQQHQGNLIPLVVRRTQAYGEDIDYEVVYGGDWFLVAELLNIEKLWSWVFNLDDGQIPLIQTEMDELLGASSYHEIAHQEKPTSPSSDFSNIQIDSLLSQLSVQLTRMLDKKFSELSGTKVSKPLEENLSQLKHQVTGLVQQMNLLMEKVASIMASPQPKRSTSSKKSLCAGLSLEDLAKCSKDQLESCTLSELKEYAKQINLKFPSKIRKDDLIAELKAALQPDRRTEGV